MLKKKLGILTAILALILAGCSSNQGKSTEKETKETKTEQTSTKESEATSGASQSADATTSASIVPEKLVNNYKPKGFTDSDKEKALFVVADPRKDSVNYDLANTAMSYLEEKGMEVELRDLYDIKFNPVMTKETFYNAKDGSGETPADIKPEQEFVKKADHIIFVYPNWHDTPTPLVKGYMERVFAKKFAYQDGKDGLQGLLTDKDIFTIMNCGYLGGGQGYVGDGLNKDDDTWDTYMKAFKVFDDDTAAFWGVKNKGRFMNDQTPKNDAKDYEKEINQLRDVLKKHLDDTYFK